MPPHRSDIHYTDANVLQGWSALGGARGEYYSSNANRLNLALSPFACSNLKAGENQREMAATKIQSIQRGRQSRADQEAVRLLPPPLSSSVSNGLPGTAPRRCESRESRRVDDAGVGKAVHRGSRPSHTRGRGDHDALPVPARQSPMHPGMALLLQALRSRGKQV